MRDDDRNGRNEKGPLNSHGFTFGGQKGFFPKARIRPSLFAEAGDLRVSNVPLPAAGRALSTKWCSALRGSAVSVDAESWMQGLLQNRLQENMGEKVKIFESRRGTTSFEFRERQAKVLLQKRPGCAPQIHGIVVLDNIERHHVGKR
jgi:hypothetical protein